MRIIEEFAADAMGNLFINSLYVYRQSLINADSSSNTQVAEKLQLYLKAKQYFEQAILVAINQATLSNTLSNPLSDDEVNNKQNFKEWLKCQRIIIFGIFVSIEEKINELNQESKNNADNLKPALKYHDLIIDAIEAIPKKNLNESLRSCLDAKNIDAQKKILIDYKLHFISYIEELTNSDDLLILHFSNEDEKSWLKGHHDNLSKTLDPRVKTAWLNYERKKDKLSGSLDVKRHELDKKRNVLDSIKNPALYLKTLDTYTTEFSQYIKEITDNSDKYTAHTFRKNMNALTSLEFQPIPKDGHCLFRAIGQHVNLEPTILRERAAAYMRENSSTLEQYFQGTKQEFEEHIKLISNESEWGDHIEIEVMQRLTGRPVIIIRPDANPIIPDNLSTYNADPIFIYYNGHNHYETFIVKKDSNPRRILQNIQNHLAQGRAVTYPKSEPTWLLEHYNAICNYFNHNQINADDLKIVWEKYKDEENKSKNENERYEALTKGVEDSIRLCFEYENMSYLEKISSAFEKYKQEAEKYYADIKSSIPNVPNRMLDFLRKIIETPLWLVIAPILHLSEMVSLGLEKFEITSKSYIPAGTADKFDARVKNNVIELGTFMWNNKILTLLIIASGLLTIFLPPLGLGGFSILTHLSIDSLALAGTSALVGYGIARKEYQEELKLQEKKFSDIIKGLSHSIVRNVNEMELIEYKVSKKNNDLTVEEKSFDDDETKAYLANREKKKKDAAAKRMKDFHNNSNSNSNSSSSSSSSSNSNSNNNNTLELEGNNIDAVQIETKEFMSALLSSEHGQDVQKSIAANADNMLKKYELSKSKVRSTEENLMKNTNYLEENRVHRNRLLQRSNNPEYQRVFMMFSREAKTLTGLEMSDESILLLEETSSDAQIGTKNKIN